MSFYYQMNPEDIPPDFNFNYDMEYEDPADYEFEFNLEYDLPLYSCTRAFATLPQTSAMDWGQELQERITEVLPYLDFGTSDAEREFLVIPILLELARYVQVTPRREYQHHALRTTPDYLLEGKHNHLVIEAKCGNSPCSFRHLYLQLIGLDKWEKTRGDTIYGAVTFDRLWQFGILHREEKRIVQDLHLYRVPEDLPDLLRVLVGILAGNEETPTSSAA